MFTIIIILSLCWAFLSFLIMPNPENFNKKQLFYLFFTWGPVGWFIMIVVAVAAINDWILRKLG